MRGIRQEPAQVVKHQRQEERGEKREEERETDI